jgi:hypothetical protein
MVVLGGYCEQKGGLTRPAAAQAVARHRAQGAFATERVVGVTDITVLDEPIYTLAPN